jgi:hypothetical protein
MRRFRQEMKVDCGAFFYNVISLQLHHLVSFSQYTLEEMDICIQDFKSAAIGVNS